MKFTVNDSPDNDINLMRRLGYHPHKNGESFARRLTSQAFPRFHIYVRHSKSGWQFSLHLDQKGVCYDGQTAHSGDYDSDVLSAEKDRIIKILS